jgi:protein ImuB
MSPPVRQVAGAAAARPRRSLRPAPALRRAAVAAERTQLLALAEPQAELWVGVHLPQIGGARQLTQLALRAQRFSPRVSLEPPDGLLLEVRGSLGLFAGVTGLRAALRRACGELRLQGTLAFAPTPLGALVAARAGRELEILQRAQLIGALAPLPLTVLRWPPPVVERLKRAGVRTLGAVLRLPRAGFARRFGIAQLAMLDRLTGRVREVRGVFRPRERFRRRQELSCEVENHAQLLGALHALLRELEDFLRARQAGVMALECRLLHRQAAVTPCRLQLAAPAADARHIGALFAVELSRVALPQPVRALELCAPTLLALTPAGRSLWQPGEHGGGVGSEAHALIERLRARLGEGAIHGLRLLEDHRPESSWGVSPPPAPAVPVAAPAAPAPCARRPLWLLGEPQVLAVRGGLPRRHGPLELVSEPERIEGGWWDGEDVARDYYTALDTHGVRLWVFRERRAPHGWFLHGIFG